MNLYKITSPDSWFDDKYDSAVVAANSEEEARNTHPNGRDIWGNSVWCTMESINNFYTRESPTWRSTPELIDSFNFESNYTWCKPESVIVELIGTYNGTESSVILAAFVAG